MKNGSVIIATFLSGKEWPPTERCATGRVKGTKSNQSNAIGTSLPIFHCPVDVRSHSQVLHGAFIIKERAMQIYCLAATPVLNARLKLDLKI
jgi:hypothetical protein